jgi:hypothetical protein
MKPIYDDRLIKGTISKKEEKMSSVLSSTKLSDDNPEGTMTRASFLMRLAGFLGVIGLTGCAIFISQNSKFLRRQVNQFCTCVPVCVCDLVCICNMVLGKVDNVSKKEDRLENGVHSTIACSCVPVCTCDLVCTCNRQCSCDSHVGGGGTYCSCNLICTCQAVYR